MFCEYFLPGHDLLFYFLNGVFEEQNFLLIKVKMIFSCIFLQKLYSFIFKSMIHFKYVSLCGVRQGSRFIHYLYRYAIILAPFVENNYFFFVHCLMPFQTSVGYVHTWTHIYGFLFPSSLCPFFCQCHTIWITLTLQKNLEIRLSSKYFSY